MRRKYVFGAIPVIVVLLLLLWPFQYIETGKAGITFNRFTGVSELLPPGWHALKPTTFVTEIDTRPQRLCLSSSSHSAVNCRLVQFNLAYYREFLQVEGWHRYWWDNRFSFNSGYPETYRGFRDVLRGYAFSAQQYPFVKIIEQ